MDPFPCKYIDKMSNLKTKKVTNSLLQTPTMGGKSKKKKKN